MTSYRYVCVWRNAWYSKENKKTEKKEQEKKDGKENEFYKMMTLASVIGRMFVCTCVILYKELEHVWDEIGLNGLMATGSTWEDAGDSPYLF